MSTIIEFKNVSFRYDEEGPWILKNCSFTIDKNESVAIIGHNGSGKSTIAKLMNGLLFPDKGEVWINGMLLNEETVWDIRRAVGMVFQNPDNQFVGTTVQDDIAFGMENRGVPRGEMIERIDYVLNITKMKAYKLNEPHRLSGGQKQRVAIAGVLAIAPEVIILDEATVMLDPLGRAEIMETINRLKQEQSMTFITITHDLSEVIQTEKVIVLNEGEIWQTTTPRKLMQYETELKEIGLDIPFITALASELKQLNIDFNKEPLTMEEMMDELLRLHNGFTTD